MNLKFSLRPLLFFLPTLLIIGALNTATATATATTSLTLASKETLKLLSGCFRVTYRFVEDGVHDSRFDLVDGKEFYEWIVLEESDNALSFQHYGVIGEQAMKHWREDWSETADHLWTQKVYDPTGEELRYECTAPIAFHQWRCHAGKAARPVIRDRGRSDYETLDRENILQITAAGWVQVEINNKLDRDNVIVANEVGFNDYSRVDESNCQPAKEL
ncbi:MAG: hypothetical protein HQK50_10780 [Oligoflexia bacterium]|nr:hypothetical protein [Oligoflexia bacterium]MBF0366046.1 hypothetical protein [Oligoflexia bacterium]